MRAGTAPLSGKLEHRHLVILLNRAHEASGMLQQEVADATGGMISQEGVSMILRGKTFPRHELVVALCEAWGQDFGAVAESIRLRTKVCQECGRTFVDMHRRRLRIFCGDRCKTAERNRRLSNGRKAEFTIERHRLVMYQDAVNAHCKSCAPDGVCWDPKCQLRPVSPYVRAG